MVFAGGGTGGHVYPAIAVADRLASRNPSFEALFIGTRAGIESRIVPEAGYRIRYILSRGSRGRGVAGQARTLASLAAGTGQAFVLLSRFKPDMVFGSGGYASVAVVLAAFIMRHTVVIQEQNSIPGMANRFLSRCAERIYLGFEKAAGHMRGGGKILVTGNPLREEIREERMPGVRARFGLDDERPVLLVFGGSQGASSLNTAAAEYLLSRDDIQGIVQTGSRDFEAMKEKLSPAGQRVFVADYFPRILEAYIAADLALARAGALSVSELAAMALPSVLVPYPWSADDHQRHNASLLADAGGALVIDDSDISGESLGSIVDPLFADRERLENMREALRKIRKEDPAGAIATDIEELLSAGNPEGEKV